MNKQQIIHHIANRLEFLLNHSDGADRVRNQDKITEISLLLSQITNDDENVPFSQGNTFTYPGTITTTSELQSSRSGPTNIYRDVDRVNIPSNSVPNDLFYAGEGSSVVSSVGI